MAWRILLDTPIDVTEPLGAVTSATHVSLTSIQIDTTEDSDAEGSAAVYISLSKKVGAVWHHQPYNTVSLNGAGYTDLVTRMAPQGNPRAQILDAVAANVAELAGDTENV